jgi:AraC family transcriptional activator of pobA
LIAEAKLLLNIVDYDIAKVSYCLGIDEPTYFARLFKAKTGVSPSEWKISSNA